MSADKPQAAKPVVGLRRLVPQDTKMFEGTFGLMHCQVWGDTLYRGVFAVMLFPISHPDRFISLRYTGEYDKAAEIGVIEDLGAFDAEQQALVRESLAKHYHERFITRILEVRYQHAMLHFTVETQLGQEQFLMPWKYERAEPYGIKGKVLLASSDNRYVIRDITSLPTPDQKKLTLYIYW